MDDVHPSVGLAPSGSLHVVVLFELTNSTYIGKMPEEVFYEIIG